MEWNAFEEICSIRQKKACILFNTGNHFMNLELLGLAIDIVQVWIVLALMLEELYTKTI